MPRNLISSKEIVEKFHIPYSTVTHYTNLGFFRVVKKQGNKRLYIENEIKKQMHRITKLANEGYPLRLIRKKIMGESRGKNK
jgi:DNA-binding transcriptional MerR regulator